MSLAAFAIVQIAALSGLLFFAVKPTAFRGEGLARRLLLLGIAAAAFALVWRFAAALPAFPLQTPLVYEPLVSDLLHGSWWPGEGIELTFGAHPAGLFFLIGGLVLLVRHGWSMSLPLHVRLAWLATFAVWPWFCLSLDLVAFVTLGLLLPWLLAVFEMGENPPDPGKSDLAAVLAPLAGMALFVAAGFAVAAPRIVTLKHALFFDLGAEFFALSRQESALFLAVMGWLLTSGVASLRRADRDTSSLPRDLSILLGFFAFGQLMPLFPEALRQHAEILTATALGLAFVGIVKSFSKPYGIWLPFPIAIAFLAWGTLQVDGLAAAPLLAVSAVVASSLVRPERAPAMHPMGALAFAGGLPLLPGLVLAFAACASQGTPIPWATLGILVLFYGVALARLVSQVPEISRIEANPSGSWLRAGALLSACVFPWLFLRFLQLAMAPMAFNLFRAWPR